MKPRNLSVIPSAASVIPSAARNLATRASERPASRHARRTAAIRWLPVALLAISLVGCVERTMKIQTDPPGAIVLVNDEEVGLSPVKFSFLWYGDYDIMLRKRGYKTVKTHHRVDAPWYQVPPIDLVSETMIIGTLHDDHVLPTYALEPEETPSASEVVDRAVELRDRALFEGP